MKNVLVIGGCGFVGSHTVDALLAAGHSVTVFDSLSNQVHGGDLPDYLSPEVEFVQGDVRDLDSLRKAVAKAGAIYHLAAAVGVGQSMYEISDYCATNIQGTANLLQAILDTRSEPEKLIIASSMSIYGEGRYVCVNCGDDGAPSTRTAAQLSQKQWDLRCVLCGGLITPIPTDEDKPLHCTSVYALSKKAQEEMTLLFGRTYGIPSVALRYFNIYGPRQSLSNPYTGVAAIFASRLMNGSAPVIFEDGRQTRDFVNVRDVVRANLLALSSSAIDGLAVNVGSGRPISICEVAHEMARTLGVDITPHIQGAYRSGDIRHCFADISRISDAVGYVPQVDFRTGLAELVGWINSQQAHDHTAEALMQLTTRGLVA
jgi:dTDP-L-rhamnose 4-epimerase